MFSRQTIHDAKWFGRSPHYFGRHILYLKKVWIPEPLQRQYTSLTALLLLLVVTTWTNCSAPKVASDSQPISHASWDSLLRKHVDDQGLVNYQGMTADSSLLKEYLQLLAENPPNNQSWSEAEQMAYWINAYNAFTIKLVVDHYPITGLKEIKNGVPFVNSVWDIKFFEIGGEAFDLNNIEHGILRKEYSDPRIHFALVCASLSCPKLQRFAFTADRLEEQLDQASREFVNDTFRNNIYENPIQLSKILSWYWMDFRDTYDSRYDFIQQYAESPIDTENDIKFLDYNWRLNEQSPKKRALLQGN